MAVQGIWSGTISFSLVAIPGTPGQGHRSPGPHLFPPAPRQGLLSPWAREKCFVRKKKRLVPPNEIIRGYEIAPDKYVLMTDEELESVSPERSRTIEIMEFIDMKEVDPIYYDHPYYLVPSKGAKKRIVSWSR